jgi:hypothetical protein
MRRRLYFRLPNANSARQLQVELLLARIDSRFIHFLARRGADMRGLREASFMQRSDLVHGMAVGLVAGAVAGVLLGLYVAADPQFGSGAGPAKVFFAALGGAIFGTWASGLIGISTPNSVLRKFDAALSDGHVLMMVDVSRSQIEAVRERILSRHPEAEDQGFDPTVPAFP